MDLEFLLTAVYCRLDDALAAVLGEQKLRQRGPAPVLADSEVLAMLVAGEFLGLATDRGLYRHFRRHHAALFPGLTRVHRTTFVRQATNLAPAAAALWRHYGAALAARGAIDPAVMVVDSMPLPVCHPARSGRCRRFRDTAAFGKDAMGGRFFLGFRLHVRLTWPGVVTAAALVPANVHDLAVAPWLLGGQRGWALGDRAYWSPAVRAELAAAGVALEAPRRLSATEFARWPRWLVNMRRRVETVLGQLAERYQAKRVWARDLRHLVARCTRKLLSHTLAAVLCCEHDLGLLNFDRLLTD
jgi:hypothetical protein